MLKRLFHYIAFVLVISLFLITGCANPASTATGSTINSSVSPTTSLPSSISVTPSSSSVPAASSTASLTAAGSTAGQMADTGKTVFAARCSSCHGASGQGGNGPALIGSGSNLAKYNNAQDLLSFISGSMPLGRAGSLSSQQYLQVLAFLLVQNKYIPATDAFNEAGLGNIVLK